MSDRYWVDLQDGSGAAIEYMVLCGAKLHRCCGEGPLMCAKERGHDGPHEDDGVVFG
jgi:hypothetical protein